MIETKKLFCKEAVDFTHDEPHPCSRCVSTLVLGHAILLWANLACCVQVHFENSFLLTQLAISRFVLQTCPSSKSLLIQNNSTGPEHSLMGSVMA